MRLILLFILCLLPLAAKAQSETVPYLDGVPVINGFHVMGDSLMVFDKPEGQITEVSLICQKECPSMDNVYGYYNNAFRSLGWTSDTNNIFYKDKKRVRVDYSSDSEIDTPVIITFHSMS